MPSDRAPDAAARAQDPAPGSPAGIVRKFSHDVVNPLHSVLALSQVLLMEVSRGTVVGDERLREDLSRIHAAAEEAIRHVLTLSAEIAAAPAPPKSDL